LSAVGRLAFAGTLAAALLRDRLRNLRWARQLRRRLAAGSLLAPPPPLVQILPTERCNLACKMCNQWGERGTYRNGHRPAQMDPALLLRLVRQLRPDRSLVSIHGGEPFAYPEVGRLLAALERQRLDVLFTTNGTLLGPYAEGLARLPNAFFIVSVEGAEPANDRIRGAGSFCAMQDGVRALTRATERRWGRPPHVAMNVTISEHTRPADLAACLDVARELGAVLLNFTLRWFVTEEAGLRWERQLRRHFGLSSSGAWRGFVADLSGVDPGPLAAALREVSRRARGPRPPYVRIFPRLRRIDGSTVERYFHSPHDTFGRQRCLFPFYAPRVHASGDVIYCHGIHEPVVGNLEHETLEQASQSPTARRLRALCLERRFAVCSRCCGLFLAFRAEPFQRLWQGSSVNADSQRV